MARKILLWVEDNPNKQHYELIEKTAIKKGLVFVSVIGVSALQSTLEKLADEAEENNIIVKGIILDLMIYGANSLEDFGYPEVTWTDAADAGEYLLKYVFRNIQPKQTELSKLRLPEKPLLILTVKSETRQEDFKKYGEQIELSHKYDLDSKDLHKRIRSWINAV